MKWIRNGVLGLGIWIVAVLTVQGQGFQTVDSEISFYSSAPLEDIRAVNKEGSGLFNAETGALAFRIPINGFQFRKSLMQQHFNEKFMESEKYPNATFEGKLEGYDMQRSGPQQVEANGRMSIHGVRKTVNIEGQFTVSGESLLMYAVFDVRLEDYDIDIPKVVFLNIAEVVEVTVAFTFQKIDQEK
jgi:hypothetical protein